MQIRVGYELVYNSPQPTPMLLMVNVHSERAGDILKPDIVSTDPWLPLTSYFDMFGNWCTRMVVPAGRTSITADAIVRDSGLPDPTPWERAAGGGAGAAERGAGLSARQPLLRD